MSGNATTEFDADYYEFHVNVSATNENSGYSVSKGRRITESILRMLTKKIGIDIKNITLESERTESTFDDNDNIVYDFEKKFFFLLQSRQRYNRNYYRIT